MPDAAKVLEALNTPLKVEEKPKPKKSKVIPFDEFVNQTIGAAIAQQIRDIGNYSESEIASVLGGKFMKGYRAYLAVLKMGEDAFLGE